MSPVTKEKRLPSTSSHMKGPFFGGWGGVDEKGNIMCRAQRRFWFFHDIPMMFSWYFPWLLDNQHVHPKLLGLIFHPKLFRIIFMAPASNDHSSRYHCATKKGAGPSHTGWKLWARDKTYNLHWNGCRIVCNHIYVNMYVLRFWMCITVHP